MDNRLSATTGNSDVLLANLRPHQLDIGSAIRTFLRQGIDLEPAVPAQAAVAAR